MCDIKIGHLECLKLGHGAKGLCDIVSALLKRIDIRRGIEEGSHLCFGTKLTLTLNFAKATTNEHSCIKTPSQPYLHALSSSCDCVPYPWSARGTS